VVAGIALAVGLGNHRPGVIVIVATVVTFACVFGSVTSAVLATVAIFHWDRQFPDQAGSAGTIYSFVEHGSGAQTFEVFKQQRATVPSPLSRSLTTRSGSCGRSASCTATVTGGSAAASDGCSPRSSACSSQLGSPSADSNDLADQSGIRQGREFGL
jgi:hypothetical protein